MVSRWLRTLFGAASEEPPQSTPGGLYGLDPAERERIGTEEDPLRGFEEAMDRHLRAARAEQRGDPQEAIRLYQRSVAEGFVGSHPYERLATLYERRRDPEKALQTLQSFLRLAASGKMPPGAQRSANRRLPHLAARAERYRRLSGKD